LAAAIRRVAAEASLLACLLVYCGPLPTHARDKLLGEVQRAAVSAGFLDDAFTSTAPTTPETRRLNVEHALIDELNYQLWNRVVLDAGWPVLCSCQILTFGSSTPLLLDRHGFGIRWLRSMSCMWSRTGVDNTCPGAYGRPSSGLIPLSWRTSGDFENKQHAKSSKSGILEASITNWAQALKVLTLAGEQGLVAVLHDVDSLRLLHQVPSQLLLPESRRTYSPDALDTQSKATVPVPQSSGVAESPPAPRGGGVWQAKSHLIGGLAKAALFTAAAKKPTPTVSRNSGAKLVRRDNNSAQKIEMTAMSPKRRKSMNVFLGNEEEGTILVVDEAFRLVLSTNLSEVPPGLLSVKDLAVVNFDLSNSLDTILLHRVVQIEDASLRKELDKLRMEGAAAALDLSSMQQQVLLFLSSSDGLLLTDSNEMSKLLVLKKDHQRIQYSATLARESLDICIRSEQQFRLLAVAASEIHQVLAKLAQELNDGSFFWGVSVLMSIMERSLSGTQRTSLDRLAQACATMRLELHRTICLGLKLHQQRLFTVELAFARMQSCGQNSIEEVLMLKALCSHNKEYISAASAGLVKLAETKETAKEMLSQLFGRTSTGKSSLLSKIRRVPDEDKLQRVPSDSKPADTWPKANANLSKTADTPALPSPSPLPSVAVGNFLARASAGKAVAVVSVLRAKTAVLAKTAASHTEKDTLRPKTVPTSAGPQRVQVQDVQDLEGKMFLEAAWCIALLKELKYMSEASWKELVQLCSVWPSLRKVPGCIYKEACEENARRATSIGTQQKSPLRGEKDRSNAAIPTPSGHLHSLASKSKFLERNKEKLIASPLDGGDGGEREWHVWITSREPETENLPTFPVQAGVWAAERLALVALLRPDRLNPGVP
jgi:hypothetical protein